MRTATHVLGQEGFPSPHRLKRNCKCIQESAQLCLKTLGTNGTVAVGCLAGLPWRTTGRLSGTKDILAWGHRGPRLVMLPRASRVEVVPPGEGPTGPHKGMAQAGSFYRVLGVLEAKPHAPVAHDIGQSESRVGNAVCPRTSSWERWHFQGSCVVGMFKTRAVRNGHQKGFLSPSEGVAP